MAKMKADWSSVIYDPPLSAGPYLVVYRSQRMQVLQYCPGQAKRQWSDKHVPRDVVGWQALPPAPTVDGVEVLLSPGEVHE